MLTDKINWLKENHDWPGLQSIIKVTANVEKNDKTTKDTRYYISSLKSSSKKVLSYVRSHWSIENSLHWVLDMSFNEDQSRIRMENAPENMAIVRHMALNMIRHVKKNRQSIRRMKKSYIIF